MSSRRMVLSAKRICCTSIYFFILSLQLKERQYWCCEACQREAPGGRNQRPPGSAEGGRPQGPPCIQDRDGRGGQARHVPGQLPDAGCLRRVLSAPDSLGKELVGLSEAFDEEASDCLIEGVLARVGGGAKGGGADLDHGYLAGGGHGGGTAGAAAGGGGQTPPARAPAGPGGARFFPPDPPPPPSRGRG